MRLWRAAARLSWHAWPTRVFPHAGFLPPFFSASHLGACASWGSFQNFPCPFPLNPFVFFKGVRTLLCNKIPATPHPPLGTSPTILFKTWKIAILGSSGNPKMEAKTVDPVGQRKPNKIPFFSPSCVELQLLITFPENIGGWGGERLIVVFLKRKTTICRHGKVLEGDDCCIMSWGGAASRCSLLPASRRKAQWENSCRWTDGFASASYVAGRSYFWEVIWNRKVMHGEREKRRGRKTVYMAFPLHMALSQNPFHRKNGLLRKGMLHVWLWP